MSVNGSLALSVRQGECISVETPAGGVSFLCAKVADRYADFALALPASFPQAMRSVSVISGSYFSVAGIDLRCDVVRSNRAEIRVICPRDWPIQRGDRR